MRIDNSNVSLGAANKRTEVNHKNQSLQVGTANGLINIDLEDLEIEDEVSISEHIKSVMKNREEQAMREVDNKPDFNFDIKDYERTQIEALTRMIQALTGKKMKFVMPDEYMKESFSQEVFNLEASRMNISFSGGLGNGVTGFRYESTEIRAEREQMNFSASGVVKTADGREIQLSVSMSMSREFYEKTDIKMEAGVIKFCDPLVINFGTGGATLTDTKLSFDLDCDGTNDSISFVGSGSGFLSIDKNGDGVINDGSELFGPKSGNGFSDLAEYDDDGNGWIDENDDIYDKLRIWTKDENGKDKLFALGVKGIGAIYLGNTNSEFSIKDQQNNMLGQVKKTGIFLYENGAAGTVQHIDMCL